MRLEIEPTLIEACNNLASIFTDQDKLEEAEQWFRQGLEIRPDHPVLYNNLAGVLHKQQRTDEAKVAFRQGLKLKPDERWGELRLATLCPTVFPDVESIDAFYVQLHEQLAALEADPPPLDLKRVGNQSCQPAFELQFHGRSARACREAFARVVRPNFPQLDLPSRRDRPRLGYVVTRKHERAFLNSMQGIVTGLADRGDFEQLVFVTPWGEGRMRTGLADNRVQVIAMPGRFDQLADAIRTAACDVLYHWEIGTDPVNYFLPLMRLAPVQCTSVGFQITSGMEEVNYYISSELGEVETAQDDYTERLWNLASLDTIRSGFDESQVAPFTDVQRQQWGLTPGRRVYACPQQIGKFHPDFDPLLAGILEADPQAEIAITSDNTGHAGRQLMQRFERTLGPSAERVRLVPWLARSQYLSLLAGADVLLDPLHFTGVTTTFDALWLGLPIVTLPTDQKRGRYTTACYLRLGLDPNDFAALNATDASQYVQLAVDLATDQEKKRTIGQALRARREILFDDPLAVSEHHRAFESMLAEARATSR